MHPHLTFEHFRLAMAVIIVMALTTAFERNILVLNRNAMLSAIILNDVFQTNILQNTCIRYEIIRKEITCIFTCLMKRNRFSGLLLQTKHTCALHCTHFEMHNSVFQINYLPAHKLSNNDIACSWVFVQIPENHIRAY